MHDPLMAVLAEYNVFQGLTTRELQRVRNAASTRRFLSGSYVFRQGEPAQALLFMFCGSAKLIQVTPDGHQILLRFVNPGDGYGLVSALDGHDYAWSMQAIDDCHLLVWQGEVLAQLMERYSRISFNALRIVALRNRQILARYQSLLTASVEQRVAQALLQLCTSVGQETDDGILINVPLSREDLAEYSGTTQFSVSRLMQKWQAEGWISTGRERVVVLDQEPLRSLSSAD